MGGLRSRWQRWVVVCGVLAAVLITIPFASGQIAQVERPAGTIIANGGTDAQGWQRAGSGQVILTYTLRNTGDAQLDVTNITAGNLLNVTVGSVAPTAFSLAPSQTTTVAVRYTPTTDGPFGFNLAITSNAPDYGWTVSGEGDATPPTVPVPLTPPDGQWFNSTAVGFTWNASTDDGSGVRDYRVVISGPVNRDYYTANTYYNPSGLVEGAYSWRLRARDWVNNHSDYAANRSFSIDLTLPEDPTLESPSHEVGVPSNNPNVQIQASGAYDPVSGGVASGVAGFEVAWDQSETWTPTQTANRPAAWRGETFVATSDGSWWVHVATVDGAGNSRSSHLGPFPVDTAPPTVVSVAVDTDPIYEGDLTQQVTVTFDEEMDPAVSPTLTFSHGEFSSDGDGAWSNSNTVWTKTFTLSGNGETFTGVTVGVSGARDPAGNTQVPYLSDPLFDIDTRKPQAAVTTDHTTIGGGSPIYEGSLVLTVTVTYDEDMDTATVPVIELMGHTPGRWTGPTPDDATGWQGARTYVAAFTHDGDEDEVDRVFARVADGSGARDLAGNAEIGDASDPFDVDTTKPKILGITADESGMCEQGCYVLGSVCPPGAIGVTVEFSEAVWQLPGDALVLRFNLDNPGSGTLAFSSISPHAVTAPGVWQPQEETRTYVVQDGDNACRLAVTEIALQGDLFDAAGNRLVVPSHPLGSAHNITDNQDINVDTTRPVVHALMFTTEETYSERETDYDVDDCCVKTVYFSAYITDNCYVLTDNVLVTVTLPTGNAILEGIVVKRTQTTLSRVDVTGSAVVRCLTSCPARVEVRVEARDCRGGPACCGNWALPQVTTTAEGLVGDTVLPVPRDDPRQDMIMDESALIDALVEVRRDDLGVYRLVVRENTPVRIDVLANDADNCSCRCDAGPHPFDPCGPCGTCPGCCASLIVHEIIAGPAYGTATVEDPGGDCGGGSVIRYAPKLGYVGPDWFSYTIRDACGNVSSAVATVRLQVIPELAMEDVFVVACAGSATEFTVRAVDLWADYDPHDVPFRFSIVAGPEHGAVVAGLGTQALIEPSAEIVDGKLVPTLKFIEALEVSLQYIPASGYLGPDTLWIRLEDPFGGSQTARVALAVTDCAPEGTPSPAVTVSQGQTVSIVPPKTFTQVMSEVGAMPVVVSLDDGTGHAHAVSIAWVDNSERDVLFLNTQYLSRGRYLLIIPLVGGERVEIVVVVKEAA